MDDHDLIVNAHTGETTRVKTVSGPTTSVPRGFIGIGWEPRCPNCGASVAKPADEEGKAGVYPCGDCGAVHSRDGRGRLILDA